MRRHSSVGPERLIRNPVIAPRDKFALSYGCEHGRPEKNRNDRGTVNMVSTGRVPSGLLRRQSQNERRFATGENRRWISASGLQRRSRPTRGSLPGASPTESGTSRTRPRYGPRLALHTRSGRLETDR